MHIGRKVTALGLAAAVVGGAAGTALAASGGSSGPQPTATSVLAADSVSQSTTATITAAQVAAKVGVSEKSLLAAIAEARAVAVKHDKTGKAADPILVKVIATDLQTSGATAEWIVGLLDSGALVIQ